MLIGRHHGQIDKTEINNGMDVISPTGEALWRPDALGGTPGQGQIMNLPFYAVLMQYRMFLKSTFPHFIHYHF